MSHNMFGSDPGANFVNCLTQNEKSFMAWPCHVIVMPISVLRVLLGGNKYVVWGRVGKGEIREQKET